MSVDRLLAPLPQPERWLSTHTGVMIAASWVIVIAAVVVALVVG